MKIPGTTIEVIQALQQRGLSIVEIAKMMGIASITIYRILKGSVISHHTQMLAIQVYIKTKLADEAKSKNSGCL